MTTRRERKTGSIFKRGGKWIGTADLGWVGGRRVRRSVSGATRAEARERLDELQRSLKDGLAPAPGRLTVGAWLDEWLAGSVAARVRPSTAASYAMVARLYLRPALGRIALGKLSPEHVGRMVADLSARGDLSPTTVRYALVVLRVALNRAVRNGRIARNVAADVDPPARVRFEHQPLTADQARAFLEATAEDRDGPLYTLAIGLGLRQGEALALRWDDIDLEARTVTVSHTLTTVGKVLAEPKTSSSRRTLRLGSEVAAALREQRLRQVAERLAAGSLWTDGGYVFTSGLGAALDSSNVTHGLQAALQRAGLPRQRFHDLRHACATLLIEAGEELAVVSRILGHSAIGTTADVYGHLTPAMAERAADRLDEVLRWRPAATS